jgi:parvulin-like peptidyl-prolyl isomerase
MRAIAEFRARSNEAEKRTAEQANKIAKELEAGSMTLEEAAEEYSLELNESSHFTQTQPSPGLNYGLDFTDAVFSSEVGGVVGPFSSQGRFVLARLEEITPSSLPEYSAIPDEVRTRFEEERSDDLTRDAAFEFFNKVEAAESFADAAKQNDLEIVETEFFKRNSMIDENLRYYPAIQEQAFALEVGKVSTPVYTGGDYVVFEVSEKSAFDEVQFENAKESLTDQLSQQKRDEFYSSYLQNAVGELRREGQIVINQELVQRITG